MTTEPAATGYPEDSRTGRGPRTWVADSLSLERPYARTPEGRHALVQVNRAVRSTQIGREARRTPPGAAPAYSAVLAFGVVLFAAGSVLLARPLTRNVATLVLAVPLAAALGALVLGVLALIVALLLALADAGFDGGGGSGSRSAGRRDEEGPARAERPRVFGIEEIESAQRRRPPGAVDPDV